MVDVPVFAPSERYPGRPPEGRLVVIAPTRAACETIELGVGLRDVETILEQEHGGEIRALARGDAGFGIVAGTGTGKTLAIRPMAEEIVGGELRVGVVNREREATPETPTWNVVIVTTGIARRWLQDDLIGPEDTLVVDEIHQTSAELELCLALGKRAGCRFIWLSATVDPSFYAAYLDSAEVIASSAFDPARAARVRVTGTLDPLDFLSDRFLRHVVKQARGVAIFVPTRAQAEQVAAAVGKEWERIFASFYHGGEPIAKLQPFLSGEAPHPFLLSMTAAGQSALNVRGLDTVVIEDARFTTVIEGGRRVLTRLPLGANEILQMAGRVHGRVEDGEVWILSKRDLDFASLEPTAPHFQLAGDPERVALTCADVGVRADDLDLPVPLDRMAYRRAVALLERRGLISGARLTPYGRRVEVLPVDRPWGELLVGAEEPLIPLVAVCASLESLHRAVRQEHDIQPFLVPGSDHLTVYRIYRDALRESGALGTVYGLPRHVFDAEALEAWTENHGVLVRAIEDAALAIASIYRSLELPLPRSLPALDDELEAEWRRLLARIMPFDLIVDGETSWGEEVWTSRSSVCGKWGAIAGDIRYFSDRSGRVRGAIEGTQLPYELLWEYAEQGEPEFRYDPAHRRRPLRLHSARTFHGFELDASDAGVDVFPEGREQEARTALAEALSSGAAQHPSAAGNRRTLRELREVHRRSGGAVPEAGGAALAERFAARLADVGSYGDFLAADLHLDPDDWAPPAERERWLALSDTISLAGDDYPLDYALEDGTAVARARVPAKLLRQLDEDDLPELDRPLRWTVTRGKRQAIRAASLEEARAQLQEARRERARGREEHDDGSRRRGQRKNDKKDGNRSKRGARKRRGRRR
ncbi:hypothetical protein BH23GEM4_BH23GEM4_06790 [soil metagenome]